MISSKYDKVNFLYRNPISIFSPYMYFEGIRTALERNGLLHYSFDVTGSASLDIKELLKYPVLCITGSSEPLVDLVSYLHTKQFIAEICPESLCTKQGDLKKSHYEELHNVSGLFDLYFSGIESDLDAYWGKPCYWLPAWAHTEILGDFYHATVTDKVGFIGQTSRRMELFSQDHNGILFATNTVPRDSAVQNLVELCKGINSFRMLVNPESNYVMGMPGKNYEIMACNRLCFNQLNERSMFKSKLLFRDNEDIIYFKSFEELEDKFKYYLAHANSLEQVAMSGFRKVRHYHSADVRAKQIVERVLHHANGGTFDAEFNLETRFSPSESATIFPINMNEVAKPFMDEVETKSICTALQMIECGADVLEWGSGNSTLYFSQFISPESDWISIEHNSTWAEAVSARVTQERRSNIILRFIPHNRPYIEELEDGTLESFYDYVNYPGSLNRRFGFIIVDGRARVACMKVAWLMLSDNGIMVLHDAQRPEYDEGVPNKAFCLKMKHSYLKCGSENIVTLFMSKKQDTITALGNLLNESISSVTLELFENVPVPPETETAAQILETPESKNMPSCVFLNTYYEGFISQFYHVHPNSASESYHEQKTLLLGNFFGDCDFYSREIMRNGWQADDLIVNCDQLQDSWARENGFNETGLKVAIEQIRRCSPDVVYIQDFNFCTKEFFDLIRPYTKLIVGQIASPIPLSAQIEGFDIIISSFPHFVECFRQAGITSYYQPLAFEPQVLQFVPKYIYESRPVECSFVGGLSPLHGKAYGLMECLAKEVPIQFWGYGMATLPADSPIITRHHGEVWGKDMFRILASSKITINRHIDVAENYANNMRLFEATGCGALLITDYKDNLIDLFEIGKEVIAYRSAEECAELVKYYLANPEEAKLIAKAGQERTLRDHTYRLRMEQTAEMLERHLRYKLDDEKFLLPERISDGHQAISKSEVTQSMKNAWKNDTIPQYQRALVQRELDEMYHGKTVTPFKVMADILKPIVANGDSILEIGCASGYYYEILEYLLSTRINYTGVDYSEAMIAMAKDYYPKAILFAADGANLFFADRQFQVVVSSCMLLHVPNYRNHIFETARVADKFIVASRTPVCKCRSTQFLKKFAYGVETMELIFNEEELIKEFAINRFELVRSLDISTNYSADIYHTTYLFKRV